MPRLPRLKISDQTTWYHLISRVAGHRTWYPFQEDSVRQIFFELLHKYVSAYFCDLAAYSLMGSHYHLVARCQSFRQLALDELQRRAALLYRRKADWPQTERQWKRFNRRLFDVSEMMRNLNQALARWYNDNHERRGSLFGQRFKSVILSDLQAVCDCMLYVDLNALRAGLVQRPEQWRWGSAYERENANGPVKLIPLEEILLDSPDAQAEYRFRLYWRGGRDAGQGAVIPPGIISAEVARGFQSGQYLEAQPVLSNGLVIGTFKEIMSWIQHLSQRRILKRSKKPAAQPAGAFFSLRSQRARAGPLLSFAEGG